MFHIHSLIVRILSPILSILIVLSPLLNVAAKDYKTPSVVTKDSERTVASGGASVSRGKSAQDTTVKSTSRQSVSAKSSIEKEMTGVLGSGTSAARSDSATDRQNPDEEKHNSTYDPYVLRKSGSIAASSEVIFEKDVDFNKSNGPAIMLLRLNMPNKSSNQVNEVGIKLLSENNEMIFESNLGEVHGRNLISISARELDSLAQIDRAQLADSLAQFDQLLIIDEDKGELLLLDFRPPVGNLKLQYQNLGLDKIEYSYSLISLESLESLDLLCDICHTVMGAAAFLLVELACAFGAPVAAVLICVVAVKFPPLAPICIASASFAISFGSILGTIVCHLNQERLDAFKQKLTSWFCTKIGICSDVYPPLVYINAPNGGDILTGVFSIDVTVGGEVSSIDYVEFDYSSNGGTTWSDVVGSGHSNGITRFEGEGSILFNTEAVGIVRSTTMKVRVRAADIGGNISDWVESEGFFAVDNSTVEASSITVTANLTPSRTTPNSLVQVNGTASYDIGGPAFPATATISAGGTEWTASIQANGSYSRSITAPNAEGAFSVSIVVSDGSISGSTSRQLVVDEGAQTSGCWVYGDALTSRDFDQNFQPIGITSCFRADDAKVQTWVQLTDVYFDESCKSNPVQVRVEYYRPNGSLHFSPILHTIPDPGDGFYWLDYNILAHYSVAGFDMSDMEGKWTIKVYVSSRGNYRLVKVLSFTLRYEFGSHLMAEGVQPLEPFNPINTKNTFCNSDEKALTWAQIYNVCDGLEVRWDFFEPTGDSYGTANFSIPDPGINSPDVWWKIWGWTNIFNAAAQRKTGDWRVDVFIQDAFGNWDLEYSDHFEIRECPGLNPSLSVSASPAAPLEGNPISLSVSASDNGYLENVSIHWNDGTAKSQAWSNIKANNFSNSVSIGPFPTSISISFFATGEDADGNIGRSPTQTLLVQDTDTEGPSITALLIEESSGNGNGIIEDCDSIRISFDVSDPSGIDSVVLLVDSTDISLGGSYFATIGPLEVGEHYITILAIDADEPPAGSVLHDTILVQPFSPPQQPSLNVNAVLSSIIINWESIPSADSFKLNIVMPDNFGETTIVLADTTFIFETPLDSVGFGVVGDYSIELIATNKCGVSLPTVSSISMLSIGGMAWNGTLEQPIVGIPVYIREDLSLPSVAELDTVFTNQQGRYQFLVAQGNYEISPDDNFPSPYSYKVVVRDSSIGGYNFTDLATTVEEIKSVELPSEFSLKQNYPNPFNPVTKIEFSVPKASHVTIEIYNVLGRHIATLVDEHLSAGIKSVTWSGKDKSGTQVSSGTYIYVLISEDLTKSMKMLLIK